MIRKRGGVFWLDIWVGKKRVRRSLHTSEKLLAQDRALDLTRELRKPKPPGVPLEEFGKRYLEWAAQSKPASLRDETLRLKVMEAHFTRCGIATLEQITTYEVEQLRTHLLTRSVGPELKRPITRTTVNRYVRQLGTMFSKARDWGEFHGENPVSRIKFYREGAKVRPLADAEVGRILAEADRLAGLEHATPLQKTFPAICRFILQTGLRKMEALHLRWTDIGDDALTVRGKGGKTRTVPLNADARAILAGLARGDKLVFDVPNRESPSVFKVITATISKNAGVRFHVHLLRHKFASNLLERGVDIVTIGELMGHSAVMVTMLYAHTHPGLKRAAVDAIAGHPPTDSKRGNRRK